MMLHTLAEKCFEINDNTRWGRRRDYNKVLWCAIRGACSVVVYGYFVHHLWRIIFVIVHVIFVINYACKRLHGYEIVKY